MSLDNLNALLVEQLQDIYYAEKQLVKALPKMAKAASAPELKTAFTDHLGQTEEHVSRLEQAFEALGVAAKATKCPAIEGLIQEAAEMMDEDGAPAVLDAGLIACGQRVEHYEIAAYGNARVFAEQLGQEEVVGLLAATLGEEREADLLLTDITTETILPAIQAGESASMEGEENEETEDATMPTGRGAAARRPAKAGKSSGQRRTR